MRDLYTCNWNSSVRGDNECVSTGTTQLGMCIEREAPLGMHFDEYLTSIHKDLPQIYSSL